MCNQSTSSVTRIGALALRHPPECGAGVARIGDTARGCCQKTQRIAWILSDSNRIERRLLLACIAIHDICVDAAERREGRGRDVVAAIGRLDAHGCGLVFALVAAVSFARAVLGDAAISREPRHDFGRPGYDEGNAAGSLRRYRAARPMRAAAKCRQYTKCRDPCPCSSLHTCSSV